MRNVLASIAWPGSQNNGMKLTILTYGSRGDIQPFLPLSLRLMEAGHLVRLAAPFPSKNFVEQHKIEFPPLPGDPPDLSLRLNNPGYNFVTTVRVE